jgi:predicted ATPase
MLESLHLKNVGPAKEMNLEFGSRLNVITGDNGLGKSFILDCAWFANAYTWLHQLNSRMQNGEMIRPTLLETAFLETISLTENKKHVQGFRFSAREQVWKREKNVVKDAHLDESVHPNVKKIILQIYADGEFGNVDPYRNSHTVLGFTTAEIWNGLESIQSSENTKKRICNGLVEDTAFWLLEKSQALEQMQAALRELSEDNAEPLTLKEAIRYSLEDTRRIPTITTAHGTDTPITLASAGVKRILTLAYMLVWTWQEHLQYAQIRQLEPIKHMVLLIDEIESHLHPKWQQVILKSILNVAKALDPEIQVQVLVTTHSPIVMQSLETVFDPQTDAWFDLDLDKTSKEVVLEKREYIRRGSLNNWITSQAFDLPAPYAPEVRAVREQISDALKNNLQNITPEQAKDLNAKYGAALSDLDPLLARWQLALEERGWVL